MTALHSISDRAQTLKDDFALLGDWEARFSHIIDLGRQLPPLQPEEYNDVNKVRGCTSQVWLIAEPSTREPHALAFRGASDAAIVQGLVAVLLALYSDQSPAAIRTFDAETFLRDIGIAEALTPQRSNGLKSMLARIRAAADAYLS